MSSLDLLKLLILVVKGSECALASVALYTCLGEFLSLVQQHVWNPEAS